MKINQPASPTGKLSHKKCSILIATVIYLWFMFSNFTCKILGLVLALFFSFVEFCWISMTIEKEDGEVEFKPFDPKCRKGHTVIKYNYRQLNSFSQTS